MAEDEDPAEAVTRLEAALERIALLARAPHPAPAAAARDTAALAARLDALIARLRAELDAHQA